MSLFFSFFTPPQKKDKPVGEPFLCAAIPHSISGNPPSIESLISSQLQIYRLKHEMQGACHQPAQMQGTGSSPAKYFSGKIPMKLMYDKQLPDPHGAPECQPLI
jgi:hypothetical protein